MLADVGHIVVVDDDPSLRQMVIRYLEDHNIPTKPASNRTELNRHLTGTIPSLIILDLRLGQDDGLDMLREIRSHSDVPVIITTGHRPDEIDRIVGLELGADDYIVKPFSLRELLARVRAVLRRCQDRVGEGRAVQLVGRVHHLVCESGCSITHQRHVIAELHRKARGRLDAGVSEQSDHDHVSDPLLLQPHIQGREALRRMVPRKRGTILFTGASASLRGRAGYGAFNSAKAGLRTFAQAMAKEYGPEGIHVGHVVVDGAVDGDKIRRRFPDAGSRRDRMLDIEGYGRVLCLSLPAAPQGLVLRGRRADVRGTLVS